MRRAIPFLIAAVLWLAAIPSWAQTPIYCWPGSGSISQSSPCNTANPLYVTPTTPASGSGTTHTQTTALASSLVFSGAAASLYGFEIAADSTLSGAAWWIMVFDAVAFPSNGAVTPAKCYAMPSGATSASYAFSAPAAFTTGVVVGVSTTGCFTLTSSAHAFIAGDYK